MTTTDQENVRPGETATEEHEEQSEESESELNAPISPVVPPVSPAVYRRSVRNHPHLERLIENMLSKERK